MKKIVLILAATFMASVLSYSQITFSVKPGLNLNGANIGYHTGNFNPYFGIQFLNTKFSYEDNDDTYESETKFNIYMPYIGSKYYVFSKESLKSSIILTVFKPLVSGESSSQGSSYDYESSIEDLSFWIGELGFGSEYFLNEQFSIGGEFGFRYILYKHEDTEYNYTDKLNLNMTYVSGSMNFYF